MSFYLPCSTTNFESSIEGHSRARAWITTLLTTINLIHVSLNAYLCVHGTAEMIDGIAKLPDKQTAN